MGMASRELPGTFGEKALCRLAGILSVMVRSFVVARTRPGKCPVVATPGPTLSTERRVKVRNILGILVVIALAIASISSMAGVAVAAPPAGSISGFVYETDGTTPAPASIVSAYDYNTGTQLGTA